MVEKLIYQFLAAWLIGFIALVIGRYAGTSKARFPDGFARNAIVFVKVWGVTFFAQLAFGYLGYKMRWSEASQSGFAEFLLPMAAGAFYARQLLVGVARASVTSHVVESPKNAD